MKNRAEAQAQDICRWIATQIEAAGARGVVLGLSGGVDSATAAALAKRALGENVLGLILPCHSLLQDVEDAILVAEHLGIQHRLIDISPVYDQLIRLLPEAATGINANIKPRLRMTVLYHHAALNNYLVLGTSNRSEWEIGYFTKHGDGAADIYPLVHLLKREVYEIAEHLNLPERIIERAPTAGLWPGQTDEGELGFSYKDLDTYLSGDFLEVPNKVQMHIRTMQQASLHKRLPVSSFVVPQGSSAEDHQHPAADQDVYDKSIEALTLISKAITSEQFLEDILRLIVMVTAEVMNSSVCSLWLVDEKEGVLRLRATQSINSEYLKERTLKVGEGVVGKVVAENRAYAAVNVLTDPYYKEKELARRMGLVSMLSMPMRVKDRVIGVINCYTSHSHVFSDLQMNVLTAVANQAAVAIENTELMVKTRVIQEELEKRKIIERAKDLLMKRFSLSGEEAYRWLQKRSMNTRKSMREVAEAVLLAMEG